MSYDLGTDPAKEITEAQGDADTDLRNTLFQLPIRQRQSPAWDQPGGDGFDRMFGAVLEDLAGGDTDIVESYLECGTLIEFENHNGVTLLVAAILKSNVPMTRFLLRKGADVHHRVQGKPPLFHAVRSPKHGPQLIRLLLDHGANINAICGHQGMNALHWAAAGGMVDAADYLLTKGLDIESTCAGAHTALHVAAGTGHLTVVKLLLAQGAELGKRAELGGHVSTFAAASGHFDIVELCVEKGLSLDDCGEKSLCEFRLEASRGATLK